MNNNESTEMINKRFFKAESIDEVEKIDKEYRTKRTTLAAEVERLCNKHNVKFSTLPEKIGCSKSTFYSRINQECKTTKGFVVELAFAIQGTTLEELTELLKIANVGKLDAKRNIEDKYVLMFFGKISDSKAVNKGDYSIDELEMLLRQKVKYKNRAIKFSLTKEY